MIEGNGFVSLKPSKTAVVTQPDPVSQDLNNDFTAEDNKDDDDDDTTVSDTIFFASDTDSNDEMLVKDLRKKCPSASRGKTLEGARKTFEKNEKKRKLEALAAKARKKEEEKEENRSDKANKKSFSPPPK